MLWQCEECKGWFDVIIIPYGSGGVHLCEKCATPYCIQNRELIERGSLRIIPNAEFKREEEKVKELRKNNE